MPRRDPFAAWRAVPAYERRRLMDHVEAAEAYLATARGAALAVLRAAARPPATVEDLIDMLEITVVNDGDKPCDECGRPGIGIGHCEIWHLLEMAAAAIPPSRRPPPRRRAAKKGGRRAR